MAEFDAKKIEKISVSANKQKYNLLALRRVRGS